MFGHDQFGYVCFGDLQEIFRYTLAVGDIRQWLAAVYLDIEECAEMAAFIDLGEECSVDSESLKSSDDIKKLDFPGGGRKDQMLVDAKFRSEKCGQFFNTQGVFGAASSGVDENKFLVAVPDESLIELIRGYDHLDRQMHDLAVHLQLLNCRYPVCVNGDEGD
jgi:hypothetical protein